MIWNTYPTPMLCRLELENGRRRRSCRVCAEGWRDDIFRVLHNTTHNLHSITNGDDWRYYYYFPSLLNSPGSLLHRVESSSQWSGFQTPLQDDDDVTGGGTRCLGQSVVNHSTVRPVSWCKESGRGGLNLSPPGPLSPLFSRR